MLRALAWAVYDDGFITTLSSELCLQPATVHALRHNRVTELAIVSLSRQELRDLLGINIICDAIAISCWSEIKRKEEEEAERARRKQQKLDEAKIVFIFNEISRRYERHWFQDQKSLRFFISNGRISGLAAVETRDPFIDVIADWAWLVNGSYNAAPEKWEDAVKVLMDKSAKDE